MAGRGYRRARGVLRRAAVVALLSAVAAAAATAQEAAVIVNRATGVESLPLDFVGKILRHDKQDLPGRKRIELLIVPPGARQVEDDETDEPTRARLRAIRRVVVEEFFGGERPYFQHWRGDEKPYKPREMGSQAAIEAVRRNPRALAVVDSESDLPDDVVVLRVDDLLPGEKGYGLRVRKR